MTEWKESEHPRDDYGKFTFKGLGENSTQSDEEKMQRRADILFPTMKNKNKEKEYISLSKRVEHRFGLGTELDNIYIEGINEDNLVANAQIKDKYNNIQDIVSSEQDKKFFTILNNIYGFEGGYSNRKSDLGGETNFGVTQKTYNDYCKNHNLPYKSVKNLTKEETIQVYYNDFWKKSYADKTDDFFTSLFLFDTAVNHGASIARIFYKKS